jgi:hypothetical protein
MTSDTDLPMQPDTLQQPGSFKSLKPRTLIVAILLSALVAGICGYLLGRRNTQAIPISQPSSPQPTGMSQSVQRVSVHLPPTTIPSSTPVISPLPVTPGWKLLQFQSQEMHFTLQYPSNLSLENPSVEDKVYKPAPRILFMAQDPNGRPIGLNISYAADDTSNDRSSNDVLFNAPVGNVPSENIQGYSDTVIIKIADLTINGHRAVHATFFRKGSTYQEPRFCESYIVQKDSGHEYSLDACTTDGTSYSELQAKVTQYSGLMGQIVNTFTIQ